MQEEFVVGAAADTISWYYKIRNRITALNSISSFFEVTKLAVINQ